MTCISGKSIDLRAVAIEDAQFILDLRLDPSRNRFMSAVDRDVRAQVLWIEKYLERNRQGMEYYFIIEGKQGEKWGTLRVYNLDHDSFTWGSWIVSPGSPIRTATESAMLVYEFGFYHLKRNTCFFEVRKGNRTIEFHKRMGATIFEETESDVFFRFQKEQFEFVSHRYFRRLNQ